MAKSGSSRRSWKRTLLWVIGAIVAVFLLIQLVPYGRDHTNPPATNPFQWTDSQAEAIARESCYDCHSNETKWWWATNIAPASWLTQNDVDGARERLNFSEWAGSPDDLSEAIAEGMPPLQYTLIHPGARLSDAEKQTLIDGYKASLPANQGSAPSGAGGESAGPAPSATSVSPTPTATTVDAAAVIGARCGSCHTTDRALAYTAGSASEAQALIDRMIQKGATVSAAEQQVLIEYFLR